VANNNLAIFAYEKKEEKYVPDTVYQHGRPLLSKSKLLISDAEGGHFNRWADASGGMWEPLGKWTRNSNSSNKIRLWELNRVDEDGEPLHLGEGK